MKAVESVFVGPNQALDDRVIEILREEGTHTRTSEEWARRRARAWSEFNLLEATAVTCAQFKAAYGTLEPVFQRQLQLIGEPGVVTRSFEQWKEVRSKAWTANDLLEATALTYAEYILNLRY